MTGEFSEHGFVAGDVRGTRAWKVDAEGRLRGIVFEKVWRPGENVAKCHRSMAASAAAVSAARFTGGAVTAGGPVVIGGGAAGSSMFGISGRAATSFTALGGSFMNSMTGTTPQPKYCGCGCGSIIGLGAPDEPMPCSGMELGCGCGFYGYQYGSNDYYSPTSTGTGGHGPIGGVIRGYGKVVLGTRGFRAEKVEILALYIDAAKLTQADHQLNDGLIRSRLAHNYGVPIFNDYQLLLAEFPPDMPERDDNFWKES